MTLYVAYNAAAATTAITTPVATGTALKTMLQIATPATRRITVVEWGCSIDGATAGQVELIETDVAATVTAHVAAGVQPYDDPSAPASLMTLGASATGYTASAEGTVTTSRLGDRVQLPAAGLYVYQFVPGREFRVQASKFVRVRVLFGTTVNMITWVKWAE